ncbi:MAG: phage portal protein [Actinomycetota bacterium]|nr:phage portal protein [Actinomycetota bacterium]
MHIRALSTDGIVGLSPVGQCRQALSLSQGLSHHATLFFQNAGTPSGILKLGQNALPNDIQGLADEWSRGHVGLPNAHRVALLYGDVEFQPLSMPLDDAQFLEQRKLSATEVARVFRVPPWMIGADSGDSMAYSNTGERARAFVTFSLRPWLVLIEQAITADPDLCPGPLYCEFVLDAPIAPRAPTSTPARLTQSPAG